MLCNTDATEPADHTIIYSSCSNRIDLKKYYDGNNYDRNSYDGILDEIINNSIVRYRYKVSCEPYTLEVDIYQCKKSLLVACVNFRTLEESKKFQVPSWFVKELTNKDTFNRKEFFII